MKKQIGLDINVGIGDHLFVRVFLDRIRDQYDRIAITHSKPGMQFWHNNDPNRWEFLNKLSGIVFSEPPYVLVPNARFAFYPNERIVKDLNKSPVIPNIDGLCAGKSLDVKNYVVITTKIRQYDYRTFEQDKIKLTPALQSLATRYNVVLLGEREVQKSREYAAECNKDFIFGIYDYLKAILPAERTIDLTIPALGITSSTFDQFRQDCLITKEARAVLTFGIGGNLWMSLCTAKHTLGLRRDAEWTTDLIGGLPGLSITKDPDQFIRSIEQL